MLDEDADFAEDVAVELPGGVVDLAPDFDGAALGVDGLIDDGDGSVEGSEGGIDGDEGAALTLMDARGLVFGDLGAGVDDGEVHELEQGLGGVSEVAGEDVLIGKHPMAPHISPKKSWEGLAGSVIFTAIGGYLAFHYLLDRNGWIGAAVGLLAVITATTGDLIESSLKRDFSIKDMSNLLPGHGGMMDRLDSIVLTAPALWLVLELVKRYL